MKDLSPSQLLLNWSEVINTLATEIDTLADPQKRKTIILLNRVLRMGLIAFYSPIACEWWKTKIIKLKKGDEWHFTQPILDEDNAMYQNKISRMLSVEAWTVIEGHFREASSNHSDSISKVLNNNIPPAIDTLRLLKNCSHNLGIHTWKQSIVHKVRGYTFKFVHGKPVKNFHPFAMLELIDQAAIELINRR